MNKIIPLSLCLAIVALPITGAFAESTDYQVFRYVRYVNDHGNNPVSAFKYYAKTKKRDRIVPGVILSGLGLYFLNRHSVPEEGRRTFSAALGMAGIALSIPYFAGKTEAEEERSYIKSIKDAKRREQASHDLLLKHLNTENNINIDAKVRKNVGQYIEKNGRTAENALTIYARQEETTGRRIFGYLSIIFGSALMLGAGNNKEYFGREDPSAVCGTGFASLGIISLKSRWPMEKDLAAIKKMKNKQARENICLSYLLEKEQLRHIGNLNAPGMTFFELLLMR